MGERGFGARWWRESLGLGRWAASPIAGGFGLLGALSLAGCATVGVNDPATAVGDAQKRDEVDVSVDALELQRAEGWDVGQPGGALGFAGSTDVDIAGTQSWRTAMDDLAGTLAPGSPVLQPYYVPTLFQSLIGPEGQRLRALMRPMHTAELDEDFARGLALRAQFGAAGSPRDTAVVVDAPGPRAVAVAAALADRFAPLFTFGNWPHPLGVVPAHQTMAAALYYLPAFTAAATVRAIDAPPVFVLDANRLAPYRDADTQFDNRYFAHLPTAEQLSSLGVKHVLYIGVDGAEELDDLNDALVELGAGGVDVKMVALADFVRADDPEAQAVAEEGEISDEPIVPATAGEPPWWWWVDWSGPFFWYRGCWWDRGLFWSDYGYYRVPSRPLLGHRGGVRVGPPLAHRPLPPSRALTWVAAARPTVFGRVIAAPRPGISPTGHVVAPPPGFGKIGVRADRGDGHIVGVRPGAAGSFGHDLSFHSAAFPSGSVHGGRGVVHVGRSGSIGRTSFGGSGG